MPDPSPDLADRFRASAAAVHVTSNGDLTATVRHRAARARTRRQSAAAATLVVVIVGAATAIAVNHRSAHRTIIVTNPSTPPSSMFPTATTAPPAYPAQPSVTSVPGYSSAQAAAITAACVAVSYDPTLQGAVLRDATTDSAGTTLIITTTTGWETCNIPTGGTPTQSGSRVFQTWAATDGWERQSAASDFANSPAATAQAPTPAPDYYLVTPVETVSAGGGVVGDPIDGWRTSFIGRAAAGITTVSAVMPSGATVTAKVQNGMFDIDQITPTEPALESAMSVTGYSSAGQVVYRSPTPSSTATCTVTPDGEAVTPPITEQTCQQATPWG